MLAICLGLLTLNVRSDDIWHNIKNNSINVESLTKSELIFYKIYCIKQNINVNENLEYILEITPPLPLNVYGLRKFIEERIVMLVDGPQKQKLMRLLLMNYQYHQNNYKTITRDFKLIAIFEFLRKKNIFKYYTYKLTYGFLQELAYEHTNLSFTILKQLHSMYNIDLEKRFIALMAKNNIKAALHTVDLMHRNFYKNVIHRIQFLQELKRKPQVFLNIFELHWYIITFYINERIETPESISDLIINNRHLLINIPFKYNALKTNILKIIGDIFPCLVLHNYAHLDLLLANDFVAYHEPGVHLFYYIKGLNLLLNKKTHEALKYFYKALSKHVSVEDRAKYTFWIATSLRILGRYEESNEMYERVTNLSVHYYSHMSNVIIQKPLAIKSIKELYKDVAYSSYDWYFFALKIVAESDDFITAISLINSISIHALSSISSSLIDMLTTLSTLENKSYITLLASQIENITGGIFVEGYPIVEHFDAYSKKLAILMSAILRRESFLRLTDSNLVSSKGARGIMQIMPSTAQILCQRHNISFCSQQLMKNNHFNIKVGAKCIKELLYLFKNCLFLMIPAYNIGSVKIQSWMKFFASHFNKSNFEDMLLWVEMIAARDTRGYTKDVLNNYIIFYNIHNHKLLTIEDLMNFQE